MTVIICAKFEINQVIVTLFSEVWDKNLKMPQAIGLNVGL